MKAQLRTSVSPPEHSSLRNGSVASPASEQSLTSRQLEVFEFVARFKDERGVPPTLREVAGHFGFRSTTAAADHLRALRRKGYLMFAPRQARSHQLFPTAPAPRPTLTEVPLYERLPADLLHDPPEAEGSLTVDTEQLGLRRGERLLGLRVRGESPGLQVLEGDIVLLSRMRKAESGDAVATLLGGKCKLVTLVVCEGRHFLRGEGPQLMPADEFPVQGVMVGMIRLFAHRTSGHSQSPSDSNGYGLPTDHTAQAS